jgi:tRNA(Ile)-lysidine synthase
MTKPRAATASRKFEKTVRREGLLRKGDRVLVAFSGGPDSTALLALLLGIRKSWSLEIHAAHFNHRLRRGAPADERFVEDVCRRLKLPLHRGSADVRTYARDGGLNLEEASRLLRYGFLRDVASEIRADRIATGHTRNDQAETLLMRLLRGSGPTGLGGIFPLVGGLIIRPLLDLERPELVEYLRLRGWTFRRDESNRDRRFLRNRVRDELIPRLKKEYDPGLVRHLAQAATILRDEGRVLEGLARRRARSAFRVDRNRPALDLALLGRMPLGLARRLVRLFIGEVKGDLRAVSFEDVEALLELGPGKEHVLPDRLTLRREGGLLVQKKGPDSRPEYDFLWDGRGTLDIPAAGLALRGRVLTGRGLRSLRHDDERRACLDAALLDLPLRVRNRRPGDRYRPLGAPGGKKVKEILRAKGIPLEERDRRPVILSRNRIVWMPGLPVAEEFKVGPMTARVLRIEKAEGR